MAGFRQEMAMVSAFRHPLHPKQRHPHGDRERRGAAALIASGAS
jgi:hypothetical protein